MSSSCVIDYIRGGMPAAPEGLTYLAEFLAKEQQSAILDQILLVPFVHDSFRGRQLKRSYAQFGYAYASTGRKLGIAPPFPEFLCALVEKGLSRLAPCESFNQCIIAHYPPGAGIGWHTDAELFGDCIMAVSLGAMARLQFRRNGETRLAFELGVAPGSLYSMRGPARELYQHQVVPVKADRYALTFRHVLS